MKHPEANLQRSVCAYLDRALPPGYRYWHNHQNAPTVAAQKRLKGLGVKPGVPDLFVAGAGDLGTNFIALELKAPKGQTTTAQEDWLSWIESIGGLSAVCRSIDDVQSALSQAGVPLRASIGET